MKMPDLKVGSRVDIVFENEIMKSKAHFMKALVYDIEESKIIVSQTSPALTRHFLDRRVMVSFLARVGSRNLRFGFPSKLIDLINDYKIASGQNVEAFVLQQYNKSELVDFRMYFRVTPRRQSDVSLIFKEEKVNLIDISLGGARFTCPKDYLLDSDDKIKFKLLIGHDVFNLDTRVRDVWTSDDAAANRNLQYVRVEFEYDNKQLEASLGKAIINIERQLLSEGRL
ncbi:MAG: PilZ domain-containing protein [Smithellaceae bacterium]